MNGRYAVSRQDLEPREFPLTLRGTIKVKNGSSVGKHKRTAQPLLRGESPGFVNLLLCQHVASLVGAQRSIQVEDEDIEFDFMMLTYLETTSGHYSGSPA